LGGKGANQSIAIARANGSIKHFGAIGQDDGWVLDLLKDAGVDIEKVAVTETPTGHAIIYVDDSGENNIVLNGGANQNFTDATIDDALADSTSSDWLLFQNETNNVDHALKVAQQHDMKIAYAAAPFDAQRAASIIPHVDLIAVNEIEAQQLAQASGKPIDQLECDYILVTKGEKGAELRTPSGTFTSTSFKVDAIDTTGAGDTFLGFFLAELDKGTDPEKALKIASAASAIQVTRLGAASAIPTYDEVQNFLETHS
jgi:ribokinase